MHVPINLLLSINCILYTHTIIIAKALGLDQSHELEFTFKNLILKFFSPDIYLLLVKIACPRSGHWHLCHDL